jgi:fatty-acyl-CoA synthase
MKGLMMDTQLLISTIAQHAEKFHGQREIVSVTADNPRHRYTVRDCVARSKLAAQEIRLLPRRYCKIGSSKTISLLSVG